MKRYDSKEICPKCQTEHVLHHMKFPFRDEGGTINCQECNHLLFSYPKGTDDYSIEKRSVYDARMEKIKKRRSIIPHM